ncbi:MAG: hypothetical protein PHU42_03845 [Patescibacteria group bacterium]|nr:hypothetical protein [Patescibacteria group bacterium]
MKQRSIIVTMMAIMFTAALMFAAPKALAGNPNKPFNDHTISDIKQLNKDLAQKADQKEVNELKAEVKKLEKCANCGNKGEAKPAAPAAKPKPRRYSASKPSVATKPTAPEVMPFPKGKEYGQYITDETNASLQNLAQKRWAKSKEGQRAGVYCAARYDGLENISYEQTREQFTTGCLNSVYETMKANPKLDLNVETLAATYATNEMIKADNAAQTSTIVDSIANSTIAIKESIVDAIATLTQHFDLSVEEIKTANRGGKQMERFFTAYGAVQASPTDIRQQEYYCSIVDGNLAEISSDTSIKGFFNPGYIALLQRNSSVCHESINAAEKAKKHKNIVTNFFNGLRKATWSSVTQGTCLNALVPGGECHPDPLKALQGGIFGYGILNLVLNDKWKDNLLHKNRPTPQGGGGNGGPNQPTPQTAGIPGNGQDGGGYTGTVADTTGNQNWPNAIPQVGTPNTPPPPMANGQVVLPGQLIQGASGTPTFTPLSGGSGTMTGSGGPFQPSALEASRRAERFGTAF